MLPLQGDTCKLPRPMRGMMAPVFSFVSFRIDFDIVVAVVYDE
jgi:hypothetical protein